MQEPSPSSVKQRKRIIISWTEAQRLKLNDFFSGHIINKKAPKKQTAKLLKKLTLVYLIIKIGLR